jgi:hypothetical protein
MRHALQENRDSKPSRKTSSRRPPEAAVSISPRRHVSCRDLCRRVKEPDIWICKEYTMATYAILSFNREESSLSIILFVLITYADQVGGMEATRKSMHATSRNDMWPDSKNRIPRRSGSTHMHRPSLSLPDRCTYRSSCQPSRPAPGAVTQKSSRRLRVVIFTFHSFVGKSQGQPGSSLSCQGSLEWRIGVCENQDPGFLLHLLQEDCNSLNHEWELWRLKKITTITTTNRQCSHAVTFYCTNVPNLTHSYSDNVA